MTLDTFFEKFDIFADAPNAVAKMRELVLELAMQGKLVPPSIKPEKHPAWIAFQEERRNSTIGYDSEPQPIFEIPTHWEWCILNEVAKPCGQKIPNEKFTYIDVGSIDNARGELKPELNFIEAADAPSRARKLAQPGSVIYATVRPYLKNIAVIEKDFSPPAIISTAFAILNPLPFIESRFLFYWLRSSSFEREVNTYAKGVAYPAISDGDLKRCPVPVPPPSEQKRIVAKVDELMALCDRLEAQQQERETRHAALARASLARFADAPTPANLPFLFHPSYAIPPADLRKSILTLAVQGKLVPQDPNDEPAEELIDRIAQQRRAKKAKDYSPVDSDAVPFEAPYSWSWVRLGNLSLSSDSGWSPQCGSESRSGNEWGVLKVSAVSWGGFDPEANKALPTGMEPRPECEVRTGDFLLSRANTEELVARSVVVEKTPPRLMMSDKIVRFTFPNKIEKAFINLANLSDPSREYYMRNASGTSSSMKNIGREVMCNLPIALPPLAEQRRIVAKVEQLMALVDALETQLAASRATAANLLTALVAELTAT